MPRAILHGRQGEKATSARRQAVWSQDQGSRRQRATTDASPSIESSSIDKLRQPHTVACIRHTTRHTTGRHFPASSSLLSSRPSRPTHPNAELVHSTRALRKRIILHIAATTANRYSSLRLNGFCGSISSQCPGLCSHRESAMAAVGNPPPAHVADIRRDRRRGRGIKRCCCITEVGLLSITTPTVTSNQASTHS